MEPNALVLRRGPGELEVALPDGRTVVLQRQKLEQRGEGDILWTGSVVGELGSEAVLTFSKGILAGRIFSGGETYEIRPERGRQVMEKLNHRSFPSCGGGIRAPRAGASSVQADSVAGTTTVAEGDRLAGDGIADIQVLVMYTPQARDAAGGVTQIEAQIQAAVDAANQAFANSGIAARYTLVAKALASRNDSGDIASDLYWLSADPATASLRNTHAADMVSLFVSNGGSACGVGFVGYASAGSESSAFQVTDRDCAVGNLTYAHEHGHNLGMDHDPANGGMGAYAYSNGHFVDGVFRTVMSYASPCAKGCGRVAYFSNPLVSYLGYPTGVANERDNARTAAATVPFAAAFRSAPATAAPKAPSGLMATAVSSSQINLAWIDNSTDESAFLVQRSTDGINFSQIASLGANATSYSSSGLNASTTYTYRVIASNSAGNSLPSGSASATTQAGPPAAPSNLSGVTLFTGSGKNKNLLGVKLNWQDQVQDQDLFRVERCQVVGKGSSATCTFGPLTTLGATTMTYTDPPTTLPGKGTYKYRVRAENALGASAWATTQVNYQ